jgi:hypothetical protein
VVIPDESDSTPATQPATAAAHARTGRPGRPRRSRTAPGGQLDVQTVKSYRIGDDARRTVGYLRLILNQRGVPEDARVRIDGEVIAIEWSE